MTHPTYAFSTLIQVFDPLQLLAAATERALADGADPDDLIDDEGNPNTEACIIMLLDPGSLPGCDFLDSAAEAR